MKRYIPVWMVKTRDKAKVYKQLKPYLQHGTPISIKDDDNNIVNSKLQLWMDESNGSVLVGLAGRSIDYVIPAQLLAGPVRLDNSRMAITVGPDGRPQVEFDFDLVLEAVKDGEQEFSKEQREALVKAGHIDEEQAKKLDYAQRGAKSKKKQQGDA